MASATINYTNVVQTSIVRDARTSRVARPNSTVSLSSKSTFQGKALNLQAKSKLFQAARVGRARHTVRAGLEGSSYIFVMLKSRCCCTAVAFRTITGRWELRDQSKKHLHSGARRQQKCYRGASRCHLPLGEVTDTDREYMRQAIKLALTAEGKTDPNPMVGCVIVKDDNVRSV
eukprot:1196094-Prorocentrum_minimum.AAC.5